MQGVNASGQWCSGVLEQSWRAGGATGAEIAALEAFQADPARRVIGVARFSEAGLCERLESQGIECIACDLLDHAVHVGAAGDVGDNRLGGWYSYRAAKAAQNQLLKTWAIELGRTHPLATVLILHPGTTDTDLSRPFSAHVAPEKLFSTARVARDLLAVIAARGPADSGGFFDWANEPVPW